MKLNQPINLGGSIIWIILALLIAVSVFIPWILIYVVPFLLFLVAQIRLNKKFKVPRFQAILVGMLVVLPFLMLFLGNDLLETIFMVVVCTGGISLIPIISVLYFIGALVVVAYRKITGQVQYEPVVPMKTPVQSRADESSTVLTPYQIALIGYMQNEELRGSGSGDVDQMLRTNGWPDADITWGREYIIRSKLAAPGRTDTTYISLKN